MKKYLKYLLAVATLCIACATFALADGEVVCTLNGQPYTDVKAAANAALPGDHLNIFGDASFSGGLTLPQGTSVYVAPSARLSTTSGYIVSKANVEWYGSFYRTDAAGSSTTYAIGAETGTFNFYGSIVSSPTRGAGLQTLSSGSANARINVYGGVIVGTSSSLRASNGLITVYGGTFDPMFEPDSYIVLGNGAQTVGNSVSWGGLYEIGRIVSQSLNWITLFCASILANKLLLIFILFFMGFAGIGLIKRIIR